MYTNLKAEGIGNFLGTFYWSSTELTATTAVKIQFSDGNPISEAKSASLSIRLRPARKFTAATSAYELGDVGPSGGLIFYIDGGTTYYEAYPSDLSNAAWSDITDKEIGTTSNVIGSGDTNTTSIINQSGGANDWFLPSEDELGAIRAQYTGYANIYWSSTETNAAAALAWIFTSTTPQAGTFKNSAHYVKVCRSFVGDIGDYSIGDVGPAGGKIFYVDGGTTYYEEIPGNQSTNIVWSYVADEIGVTAQGTAIGTGKANTLAIIGQSGFSVGAAKLANDYDNTYSSASSAALICNDLII